MNYPKLNYKLFRFISDKEFIFGLTDHKNYKESILEACEIFSVDSLETWDLNLTEKDTIIVAMEYDNSNPDDEFRDVKEYNGKYLHLKEMQLDELYLYLGKQQFQGSPHHIIGYGFIDSKNMKRTAERLGIGDDGGGWEAFLELDDKK
jgi:hypothetical protein